MAPSKKKPAKNSASKRSSAKAKAAATSANPPEIYRCECCSRSFDLLHHFEDHVQVCKLGPNSDIRERPDMKPCYISMLGLERKPTEEEVLKAQSVALRTTPLAPALAECLQKYYASFLVGLKKKKKVKKVTVTTKKGIKTRSAVSTSTRARMPRKVKVDSPSKIEMRTGTLRKRSIPLKNQFKQPSVRIDKLPEKTVKVYMEKAKQKKEKKKLILDDVMKKCSPEIKLVDIIKYPKSST